jgi:hypothetical protein
MMMMMPKNLQQFLSEKGSRKAHSKERKGKERKGKGKKEKRSQKVKDFSLMEKHT